MDTGRLRGTNVFPIHSFERKLLKQVALAVARTDSSKGAVYGGVERLTLTARRLLCHQQLAPQLPVLLSSQFFRPQSFSA